MAALSLDEETAKRVFGQVEFYFSDSNLPRDKFLTKTLNESEDGLISLALICSLTKMRNHLGLGDAKPEDISEDTLKAVAETLKTSSTLKLSEDGKKIGRATQLPKPEVVIEPLDARTIAPNTGKAKISELQNPSKSLSIARVLQTKTMAALDEETAKKVFRQVEFYFSDSNLPRDKFLTKTLSESEDGLISLALICSFTRMRNHLGLGDAKPEDISEDTLKAVAETLKTSSTLKLSEDGKKIGRATELPKPEVVIEQLDVRTIAASPLAYDAKLEDVESFFAQFAKITSVRLPRHVADKRLLCGTALIEFSTDEEATKVLKETIVYDGVKLELRPKKDFDAERAKQEEEFEKFHAQKGSKNQNSRNTEDEYPEGLIIAFKLKSKPAVVSEVKNGDMGLAEESDVSKTESQAVSSEMITEEVKDDEKKSQEDTEKESQQKVDEESRDEKKEVEGVENEDETSKKVAKSSAPEMYKDNKDVVLREDLKVVFKKFGTVKFIDFKIGEESGYVRFDEEEAGQKARAAAALTEEGGLTVKNYIVTLDPVTGEAEKEYWSLLRGNQDRCRGGKGNRGRGGKHNRGGGGRHFSGKNSRSRENDSSNRSSKIQKV